MQRSNLIFIAIATALALTACGSDKKPPLKGERISILEMQNTLEVDKEAAEVAADLPAPKDNIAWPQVNGNPTHTPVHVALGDSLKRIWSTSIGDGSEKDRKLVSSPIIINDRVIAANTNGKVMAYSLDKGKKLWEAKVLSKSEDSATVSAGLCAGEGKLFVTDGVGHLIAMNPDNGQRLWEHKFDHPVRGAPTYRDGRVYVITLSDETVALNANDGSVFWTHTGVQEGAGLLGTPSPAAEGSVVITTYSSGDVVALRAETGQEAWTDNLTGVIEFNSRAVTQLSGFHGNAVLDGDKVIVGNNASRTIAIHVPSGERLWQKEFGAAQTPWVAGNTVFVLTTQNEVISMIEETGKVRWVTPLARFEDPKDKEDPIFWGGPLLAGGRLILVGSNEKMIEIDPQNGKILKQSSLPDKVMLSPVVANGTMVILTDNGNLVAYR